MSDNYIRLAGQQDKVKQTCRVAYTLNNSQPVRSTIIGDQPLFFMDYEGAYDEEVFFDMDDLGLVEHEIDILQKSVDAYARFTSEDETPAEKKLESFTLNARSFQIVPDGNAKTNRLTIQKIEKIIKQSRIGQAYMMEVESYNITIELSNHVKDASYHKTAGKILINAEIGLQEQILLCVRELRRHWQHRRGALVNPLMFHPDNAILINRLQTADLTISMIRVAWELQLAGHKDIWDRLESSSLEDVSRAYAKEAFLDFRTINSGIASVVALESWFLSERCRYEDKQLIYKMLADQQSCVFDDEIMYKTITPDIIAALGSMPYGKNYLAKHVNVIMSDPIFTDVRDRSNANFLWFIKFERSYSEAEQSLQHMPHSQGQKDPSGFFQTYQDQSQEYEQAEAKVVTLFSEADVNANKKHSKSGGDAACENVVYLRRGPSETS